MVSDVAKALFLTLRFLFILKLPVFSVLRTFLVTSFLHDVFKPFSYIVFT